MGAMTLLVDQRGSELKLDKNAKVVSLHYPDGTMHRVGLYALRRIIVSGDVNLPATLLRAAAEANVSVVLLPGRGKGNGVNLFPYLESNLKLRLAQYRAYFDTEVCLSLARQIAVAKIQAQSSWLARHNLSCDFSSSVEDGLRAPDNATLMGLEGNVAKKYFAKWRSLWDNAWKFKERNRRPPRDPVNALLSLSYTLAGNHIGQWVNTYGLDVSIGFLHVPLKNRPSLALDLLEPVRPWIDEWLWQQVHDGLLTPKQFTINEGDGCRLDKDGRKAFFAQWFNCAEPWLRVPIRDSLAGFLRTLRKYSYPVE